MEVGCKTWNRLGMMRVYRAELSEYDACIKQNYQSTMRVHQAEEFEYDACVS